MMRSLIRKFVPIPVIAVVLCSFAHAGVIVADYGDEDGFGIGAVATLDPAFSNAVGDAPGTDVRLIGGAFIAPAFEPVGSFDPFVVGGSIVSASLTMSAGAWDTNPPPVDGVNQIVLDGMTVPASFFTQFTANNGFEFGGTNNAIETQTIALPPAFFPLLADGSVSLSGTNLVERSGSGSFQIDYLRLTIVDDSLGVVPEPGSLAIFACVSLGLIAGRSRRQRQAV